MINFEYRIQGKHGIIGGTNKELLELISIQWENFKNSNGVYPTAQDINRDKKMISGKTIERRLGGIKKCRELLNHSITNYSQGQSRSNTAEKCMMKAYDDETELAKFLIIYFGKRPNVSREEPYLEIGSRYRADFGVYHKNGHFFVDTFSAKDTFSLHGSINHKQNKIKNLNINDNICYVSTNDTILTQEIIDSLVMDKKNKLPNNVIVLTLENFKNYCQTLTPSIHL